MKEKTKIVSFGAIDLSGAEKRQKPNLDDLPVIATRDLVLFPGIPFPVSLGRELSMTTATKAYEAGMPVGVFCQKDSSVENPSVDDLYDIGVVAEIVKIVDLPDDSHTAILQAHNKIRIAGPGAGKAIPGVLSVTATNCRESKPRPTDKEFAVLCSEIRDLTLSLVHTEQGPDLQDFVFNIQNIPSLDMLVNLVATHTSFPVVNKMEMLSKSRLKDRAEMLLTLLNQNVQMAEIKAEIQRKTQKSIEEGQRNAVLRQEYETLREELFGDDEDCTSLAAQADKAAMPEKVRKTFDKELDKLRRLNPQAADYSVQYSYLSLLTELPWNKYSSLNTDFSKAEEVLDADHYGLEKVKERILEQIAVMMNHPEGRSPIICLVGAPGVGKTSLGRSIATALGREYQRVSLGGLHDEAEIRGHRRTYIGAMPGRIIDAVKRAGTSNPVILLDEIDKTGSDFKGDPSSALLEVLDPEQNCQFHDNYVDVDFDLSDVLFITTANTLSTIAQPLLDRMEVIDISGYLLEEKVEIARRHLIPRVAEENGLDPDTYSFTPEAIVKIVESYTAESGVRQLEKMIAKVTRQLILRKMRNGECSMTITPEVVREYLGVERFTPDRYEVSDLPGVAVGLAWTQVGGEILFIEAVFTEGKGDKLTLTGSLGDVMKESAVIASQVVRSRVTGHEVDAEWFEGHQLHVHVPEGAIPKDGPSAGITLATAIMSAITKRPLKPRLAMTGELTLSGKVLPVGGIKEKILAAKRAGITELILCKENRKDIGDIRPVYLEGLEFHYVTRIEEVFDIALQK